MLLESKDPYEKNRGLNLALRGHLSTALLITLLLVLVSVPIFVVIPRGTLGVLPPKRNSGHLSGFSEKVSLGEMGEILINEEVVVRIKVDKPPHRMPPGLKWRGIAFDHYDGKTWSSTRGLRQVARDDRLQGFLVAGRRRQEEFLIRQTIQQEPLTRVLFGLPDIILISGRLHGPYVFQDGNRSFRAADVGVRTYTIFSDVMTRDEKLSLAPVPAYVEAPGRHYLQLPELNPEVVRLARRITAGITDPIHKAFMVEQFLKENYEYSLKNTSASTRDPLSDFLFESRAGHCEYFATAQAVLLRTLGIPTRVVNGFKRGDYNRWNGYFMVRHSDAHSWVEAYFPGREWIEFDATPAVSAVASLPVLAALRELLDAIDLAWLDVVTFDHLKQYGLFQTLGDSWKESWDSSRPALTGRLVRVGLGSHLATGGHRGDGRSGFGTAPGPDRSAPGPDRSAVLEENTDKLGRQEMGPRFFHVDTRLLSGAGSDFGRAGAGPKEVRDSRRIRRENQLRIEEHRAPETDGDLL